MMGLLWNLRLTRDDSAKSHEIAAALVVADDSGESGGDTNSSNGEAALVEATDGGEVNMVVQVT